MSHKFHRISRSWFNTMLDIFSHDEASLSKLHTTLRGTQFWDSSNPISSHFGILIRRDKGGGKKKKKEKHHLTKLLSWICSKRYNPQLGQLVNPIVSYAAANNLIRSDTILVPTVVLPGMMVRLQRAWGISRARFGGQLRSGC